MATECVLIVILSGSCCCVLRLCLSWSVLVLLLSPVCLGLCVSPVSFPLCFVSVLVLLMRPVFAFLFSNPFCEPLPTLIDVQSHIEQEAVSIPAKALSSKE
jgi:hypothetical protein